VPHEVLVWEHGDVPGNLMQAAREARYGLMAAWAKGHGVDLVMLAHTADDQAETFLMGLSRAAGLDGLSGMRPEFAIDGVAFRRPFLSQTRADLRAYLTRHSLPWIDDPSNDNDRFTRIKARRALQALSPLGIGVGELSAVISNLSAVQGLVRHAVSVAAEATVTEVAGALRVEGHAFAALHLETQRRLLIEVIRWVSGATHPPREAKLAALERALSLGKDATLGGVRFRWQGQTCWISREARACGGPVPAGQVWDGRWHLTGKAGEVRALGPEGLRQCPDWRATGLPRQVLEVTPGLWQGEQLLAAPCAIFGREAATCAPSFKEFSLSH
jgi:tRNA(Ile)-lysidine synthase